MVLFLIGDKRKTTDTETKHKHFKKALSEFTPAALNDVNLQAPGEFTKKDVGGLKEVWTILEETFKWPSQVYLI